MSKTEGARRRLLFSLLLGGALVGLVQTIYGPAFPAFESRFSVAAGWLGLVVGAHFLGNLLGTGLAPWVLGRLGFSGTLPLGPLLMALGAFGLALAPFFGALLLSALLVGLGFGLANTAQLVLTGAAFADRRFWAFNLESAAFGLGSMFGPWLVGVLSGSPLAFSAVGVLALFVAALLLRVPGLPPVPREEPLRAGQLPLGFMGLFFLYIGLEASAGHWGAYHLAAVGALAAFWTGLYWGFQTVGRFLLSPFTRRVPERLGFLAASGGAALLFLAVGFMRNPGPGYAAAGFALAPAFPAAMAWAQSVLGPGGRTTAWLLVAAALGGAVFPSLFGLLVAAFGARAVPFGLAALSLVVFLYALFFGLTRRQSRP